MSGRVDQQESPLVFEKTHHSYYHRPSTYIGKNHYLHSLNKLMFPKYKNLVHISSSLKQIYQNVLHFVLLQAHSPLLTVTHNLLIPSLHQCHTRSLKMNSRIMALKQCFLMRTIKTMNLSRLHPYSLGLRIHKGFFSTLDW